MDHLRIRDFQSLSDVELRLGKLTVLTGPSNSGKSAVLRAIKALTRNVASPTTIVRHGAKKTTVRVGPFDISGFQDDMEVLFERGKALSQYTIEPGDGEPLRYTKAGTSVPADVAKFFRFVEVEGEDLNFALQFDRPFLLDAPATKVAKVLGDLTGINVIFEAVREANRRRLETASRLKVRRQDVETLRERAKDYADVGTKYEFVKRASHSYWEAVRLETQAKAVVAQLDIVEKADAALAELKPIAEPPDLAHLDKAVGVLAKLTGLISDVETQDYEVSANEDQIDLDGVHLAELDDQYHRELREAGKCPTCLRPL